MSNLFNRIIHFSVYHRTVVLILTAMLAVWGWMSFKDLPIDAVPDITNVQVQVNADVNGLAPEEIERYITFPIETAMTGIAGVTEVRSFTRFGLAQVSVIFDDNMNIYLARQLVSERLQSVQAELPRDVEPKLGPISTGLGEIVQYEVDYEHPAPNDTPERVTQLMELRALQDWVIKPRLLTTKGVAEVNAIGGFEKQYTIQPDPKIMARHGLQFADIVAALEKTNRNTGGGYVQQTSEQFLVQATGLFTSIDDIKHTSIKSLGSLRPITIGEVAQVTLASTLRMGVGLVGQKEAVIGTALMLIGENSRTVAKRVVEHLGEIQKSIPEGVHIRVLYDRSELVNKTLNTVIHNLLTGASLVIVILLLLLGNFRAAIVTATTIPLSLLIAFILMRRNDISGNLMSLGALDFGIIVDGAVIVMDNCVRVVHSRAQKLGRALRPAELKKAVLDAAVEIRTAAGFGEVIIVVVFLPIFALVGVEGKMFKPMAATFCFAIFGALVLSFTTVPALATIFLSGKAAEKTPWIMRKIEAIYERLLPKVLRFRRVTIGIAFGALVLGVILFSRLGGEFLPQLDEGSYALEIVRPVSINLTQAIEMERKTSQIVSTFPEVSEVFSRIGSGEVATDPMPINGSDTFVGLKPESQWPKVDGRRRTKAELTEAIQDKLERHLPGQSFIMSQPIQMRFNELLEGTKADVAVKVFGEDMDKLSEITRKLAEVIRTVPGAGDVETELRGTNPVLKVNPKTSILNKLGASTQEVLETVRVALGGQEVGFFFEGVRRFPIVIRLSEEDRSDLDAIRNLPVGIAANATMPLSDAATIKFSETYGTVIREQVKRRAAVLVNPRGRDTESFVHEAQAAVEKELKLPSGYYIEWGGNFKNLKEAKSRLMVLTPMALVLVLMMIYAAFGNIYQTLLIFACVPLALIGGVLGLLLNGLPFSISAGVGFIALCGIAVLNGVVLMNFFNDLRKEGKSGDALVEHGALMRLRPVLMTALVDVFGFLPMMLSHGVGSEVQRPLASVVIGGIVSSTLLTLVVLPDLYRVFEKWMEPPSVPGLEE